MEQIVLRLALAQAEAGYDVGVLAMRGGSLKRHASELSIKTRILQGGRARRAMSTLSYFASKQPNVVHAHGMTSLHYASLSKLVSRPALILTIHGDTHARQASPMEWHLVSAVTVVSNAARESVSSRCKQQRLTVIQNGVDTKRHVGLKEGLRSDLGIGDVPVGVIVARLNGRKGHLTLLESLARLRKMQCAPLMLFVGDGDERARLEAHARCLRLTQENVRFLGTRSDVPSILRAADFFVLPSETEGLPLSILEAMAEELPIIASRVGGIPELVDDCKQGLLVPPNDPVALAAAIQTISQDKNLRSALGAAARVRVVECFSFARMCQRYEELYDRAIKGALDNSTP